MNRRKGSASPVLVCLVVGRRRNGARSLENIQDAIAEFLAAVDQLVQGQDVREVSVAS